VRLRRGDPLVPSRRREVLGHADFADTGEGLLRALVDAAGLTPSSTLVELGCGHGPLARALIVYLDPAAGGAYLGLDADADAVGWCRRRYARRDGFAFAVAVGARLPVGDAERDVALVPLGGALPEAAAARLAEARRVARTAAATAFVLDDASRAAIAAGEAGLAFPDTGEGVVLLDEAVPDEAVAYDRAFFGDGARVRPGRWRGGEADTFEDLVCS